MPSLEILKEGLTQFEMKNFSMTLELEICSVAMFLKLGKQRSREKTGEKDRENETFTRKNEGLTGSPGASALKNPPVSAGATGGAGSVPGSGRSPEGGDGNLIQYSCLENSINEGTWLQSLRSPRVIGN